MLNLWELLASLPRTSGTHMGLEACTQVQPGLSSPCDPRQVGFVGWGSLASIVSISPGFLSTWLEFRDSVILRLQSLRPGRSLQFPLLER